MITITAEIDKSDFNRWLRALKNVQWRAMWWFEFNGGELNRRCAELYSNKVIENITTQKYASVWSTAPYNKRYGKWKNKYFAGLGFWQLKGDLLRNVNHFRVDEGWFGGVQEGIKDSGGKSWYGKGDVGPAKDISAYGTIMEWGGSFGAQTHPARPLFSLTLDDFSKLEWLSEINKAMQEIERAWQ